MLGRAIRRFAILLAGVLLLGGPPAFADIKAYNDAVLRGDTAAAAREARSVWATFDRTREDAVVVATEFAWMSMLAGEAEAASGYARWILDEAPSASGAEKRVADVLIHWSALAEQPTRQQINALSDSLQAWIDADDRSGERIANLAARRLYEASWREMRWEDAQRDAALAARIHQELGEEAFLLKIRAQMSEAAARFLEEKTVRAWTAMADAHDLLTTEGAGAHAAEGVEELDATAHAWMLAMDAYFRSNGGRNVERREKAMLRDIQARRLRDRCEDAPCGVKAVVQQCEGQWRQTPPLNYPSIANFKNLVGATILRVTTDEAGAVSNVRIMAAVPDNTFPEHTQRIVSQWRFVAAEERAPGCTIAGERQISVLYVIR